MADEVFISYARTSAAGAAQALHDHLEADGIPVFMDTEAIGPGEPFPTRIKEALLGAHVIVAVVDDTYFRRPYCAKEWHAATAAFRRGSPGRQDALANLMICLGDDVGEGAHQRLPGPARGQNLPAARDAGAVGRLVRARLASAPGTLGDRLEDHGLLEDVAHLLDGDPPLPDPGNLALVDHVWLGPGGESLRERFVGRSEEVWRLHSILDPEGVDPTRTAAVTAAVQGGGGFGKTQLAREYFLRFGPLTYPGGIFWIDAEPAGADLDLEDSLAHQWHEILRSIDPSVPPLDAMLEARRDVARELTQALRTLAARARVLVVVDNVPEVGRGGPHSVAALCPGCEYASVLATSRRRLTDVRPGARLDIDVIGSRAGVRLLGDGLDTSRLQYDEWEEIAEWVGRLPLVLDLLNKAMDQGLDPRSVLQSARREGAVEHADRLYEGLRGVVPAGTVRSIGRAFEMSYAMLDAEAQEAAECLGWMSPALLSPALVDAVCEFCGGDATRIKMVGRFYLQAMAGSGTGAGPRESTPMFRMHSILGEFLRTRQEHKRGRYLTTLLNLQAVITPESCADPAQRREMLDLMRVLSTTVDNSPVTTDAWSTDEAEVLRYLAWTASTVGRTAGRREPLLLAIRIYRLCLPAWPRHSAPAEWASTQNSLGTALCMLGELDSDTDGLETAVGIYRQALEETTRAAAPMDWAMVQTNLGTTLMRLGERARGTAYLEEAIAIHQATLDVYTREGHPAKWAGAQNNLGNALCSLGERLEGPARLEQAVAAFRRALDASPREESPLAWAMAQNNLGNALLKLGELEPGTERFEEALDAYRLALQEHTRERIPLQWAMTQCNVATTLLALGERETGPERLQESVAASRLALEENTRDRSPLQWARTQRNLAGALVLLGVRTGDATYVPEAVGALRLALLEFRRERAPREWAGTMNNLGGALLELGQKERSVGRLDEAAECYRVALEEISREESPRQHERVRANLARVDLARERLRQGE